MQSLKLRTAQSDLVFHCVTYVKSDERLLERDVRNMMKNEIYFLADLLELEVLAYVILPDHCHLLLRDRDSANMDFDELSTKWKMYARRRWDGKNQNGAVEIREQNRESMPSEFPARMGNISVFLKELKQRVSLFHNKLNRTCGALWKNRFRTIVVDPDPAILGPLAAYLHLNPVRHLLCTDPADYFWSSFRDALGGDVRARPGLLRLTGEMEWEAAMESYSKLLYGQTERCDLPAPEELELSIKSEGRELQPHEALLFRHKRWILTDLMGDEAFLQRCEEKHASLRGGSTLKIKFTESGEREESYTPSE